MKGPRDLTCLRTDSDLISLCSGPSVPELPTQSAFKKLTVCLGPKMVPVVLKMTRYITVVQCLKEENDPQTKAGQG